MPKPEGNLTSTQHEIIEAVWQRGDHGATVAEIWQVVSARRPVGRTTILNLVDRLEKRGWLVRREDEKPARYSAALDPEQTAALLAGSFVDDFFGGSASKLLMSLLGSKRLGPVEIEQLGDVLRTAANQQRGKQENQS